MTQPREATTDPAENPSEDGTVSAAALDGDVVGAKAAAAEEAGRLRLRPSLLALGLLLATFPLYAPNFRLYARFAVSVDTLGSYCLAMAVTIGLVGLGCAVTAPYRTGWRGFGRRALWAASSGYVLVFAGIMACVAGGPPAGWLPWALGAVGGVCTVPVVFGWMACFPSDLRSALLHAGLACGLAALVTWGLGSLPPLATAVAAVLAATVGALVPAVMTVVSPPLWAASAVVEPADGLPATAGGHAGGEADPSMRGRAGRTFGLVRNLLSIVWLPFLGFLTFVFITGGYQFPEGLMALDTEATGALLALVVVLVVCLPRYRTPLALVVEKIAVPACVACSIVLGSFPNDTPLFLAGAASVFVPLIFMGVYAGSLFAVVSKGDEFPSAFAVGVALFLACTVSTLGVTVSTAARIDLGPWAWVVICAYFGLVIVDLGVTSWRRIARPATEAVPEFATPAEDQVDRRVQGLVQACGLSAREGEILGYLARGYNSTYIAKALFISSNTVRSHIYNLYRKLGVTSRAELLELVNE